MSEQAEQPAAAAALSMYGVIPAEGAAERLSELAGVTGLGGSSLRLVTHGALSVVVSDAPPGKIRPERRHLLAHQGVLRALGERGDVLPMAFGLVARSEKRVKSLLRDEAETLLAQLERVAGHAEMTLRISIAGDNAFSYFVGLETELRSARDRLVASGGAHEVKMEVGRLFERVLTERREEIASALGEALAGVIGEERAGTPRNERELYTASLLVARDRLGAFEAAVDRIAEGLDDSHVIDVSGPWPPHSFVEARLTLAGGAAS